MVDAPLVQCLALPNKLVLPVTPASIKHVCWKGRELGRFFENMRKPRHSNIFGSSEDGDCVDRKQSDVGILMSVGVLMMGPELLAPGVLVSERNILIMGPRYLVSTTWYLNKTRIRSWDHFPVVVKIDGRVMRVKKEKKGGRVG